MEQVELAIQSELRLTQDDLIGIVIELLAQKYGEVHIHQLTITGDSVLVTFTRNIQPSEVQHRVYEATLLTDSGRTVTSKGFFNTEGRFVIVEICDDGSVFLKDSISSYLRNREPLTLKELTLTSKYTDQSGISTKLTEGKVEIG